MTRSRDDLRTKRRRAKRQRAWERRVPMYVTRQIDASGRVTAVAWGGQPVSPEQMERDIAFMQKFASEVTSVSPDDIVYRSREE